MDSCIYEGQVRHSRLSPVLHRFRYRIFFMYLDLAELDDVFKDRWFWSANRTALARFRREHHLGDSSKSLDESVRDRIAQDTGKRPTGPIRLLTHLSYFGYCFNPVSFYYCYKDDGTTLDTIVTEVNNTPWGEQDIYVLPESDDIGKGNFRRFRPHKKMHVSPFIPMDVDYDWSFSEPSERLSVFMANYREGEKFFSASITLERTEISGTSLARVLVSFPFMTLKVITAIYWQALRLYLKRAPLHVHPKKQTIVEQQ